jgi:hypothetical protein
MIPTDLLDLGLAIAFAIVAFAIGAFLRSRAKTAARRDETRERD